MIGDKSTTMPKTYGPFKMSVPKTNNDDMYKYNIKQLFAEGEVNIAE